MSLPVAAVRLRLINIMNLEALSATAFAAPKAGTKLSSRFALLLTAVGLGFFTPASKCGAESGEFDPSLALHFDAPVVVGQYAENIMERIVTTQTQFIRHEATEYQRKVAEARARAYVTAQQHAEAGGATSKAGKAGGTGATAKKNTESKTKQAAAAKLPRYIAVDTVKDSRSAPGTKKVVMIWDTHSESFVNNDVYDVMTPPAIGSNEKFDTYTAQYVGPGVATTR